MRTRNVMAKRIVSLTLVILINICAVEVALASQKKSQAVSATLSDSRPRTVAQKGDQGALVDTRPLNAGEVASPGDEAAIQSQINAVYSGFYNSYRLGPGDVIAIYIDKHPDDSVQRVAVSPVGRIYFPLLGDVSVVGKTLPQLQEYFANSVAEFIKDPRLTLALLEAQSAKIGGRGDSTCDVPYARRTLRRPSRMPYIATI